MFGAAALGAMSAVDAVDDESMTSGQDVDGAVDAAPRMNRVKTDRGLSVCVRDIDSMEKHVQIGEHVDNQVDVTHAINTTLKQVLDAIRQMLENYELRLCLTFLNELGISELSSTPLGRH